MSGPIVVFTCTDTHTHPTYQVSNAQCQLQTAIHERVLNGQDDCIEHDAGDDEGFELPGAHKLRRTFSQRPPDSIQVMKNALGVRDTNRFNNIVLFVFNKHSRW